MWIVAGNMTYYPWIMEFETYEEAKGYYDKESAIEENVYLAEVKETKCEEEKP